MTISNHGETALLDAVYNADSVAVTDRYVKLHVGDPGENCTSNPATETDRQQLTDVAASGNTVTSGNDLVWTNVVASEDYTFVSIWDDPTAGNPWWYGPLTANPVTAGDTFTIPAGSLTVTLD